MFKNNRVSSKTSPKGKSNFHTGNAILSFTGIAILVATIFTMWTPSNLFSNQMQNIYDIWQVQSNVAYPTPTALPPTRIGIVAGHYGNDSGSVCSDGFTEMEANLKIATLVVQKLKGEPFGDAPRALILVKDKQAALDLEAAFSVFIRGTYLRLYCAHEEDSIDDQKDDIYDGTDIVIATPQRLNKIFYLNGINLNKLQICIVDDAEFLLGNNDFTEVSRTSESIGKCQYLIFAKKFDQRFERWQDTFMNNAQIITL